MARDPGWLPDPDDPELMRYWDGSAWTERAVPLGVGLRSGGGKRRSKARSEFYSTDGLVARPLDDDELGRNNRRRLRGAVFGYVLLYALFWGGAWILFAHGDIGQPWVAIAGWTSVVGLVAVLFVSLVAAIRFGAYLTRVRHVPAALAVVVGSAFWFVALHVGVLLWPLALWLSERHDLFRDEDDLPSLGAFDEIDDVLVVDVVRTVTEWALLR